MAYVSLVGGMPIYIMMGKLSYPLVIQNIIIELIIVLFYVPFLMHILEEENIFT